MEGTLSVTAETNEGAVSEGEGWQDVRKAQFEASLVREGDSFQFRPRVTGKFIANGLWWAAGNAWESEERVRDAR